MKNLMISLVMTFVTSFFYSQNYPKVLIIENDTCFVFSMEQAKKITEWTIKSDKYKFDLKLSEEQIRFKDSILQNQNEIIKLNSKKEENYILILKKNKDITDIYITKNELLSEKLKTERRKKIINRMLGIVGTTIFAILYILK